MAELRAASAEGRELLRHSLRDEQPSQNWSGQGESDCLIKTKHWDVLNRCWRNVISAQCSEK